MDGIVKSPHLYPGETGIDPSVAYKRLECTQWYAEIRYNLLPMDVLDGVYRHKKESLFQEKNSIIFQLDNNCKSKSHL
jgi:hypothetical protein